MIDVRMFTVGPVQENCFIVREQGSDHAVVVDPGDEAERLIEALDALGIKTVEAILLTHTHFDHIGAVAPLARATGAPVYCPELETIVLANVMDYVPWPGFGPFESYDADHTVKGGESLELAGLTFDVLFTPGHSPGHVTYSVRDREALFSGDVLFQGSVGRVDLPGGDWPTLLKSIEMLTNSFSPETTVYPGHMGLTTLGARAGHQPLPARARSEPVIQAPRGTFDVLPDDAARREILEARAARILGAAGYRRIETPTFEATELFARGVGEATDIVQKEMYTFDDGGGRSLTLRPEGTAPVCRAYLEHGMHKLPQPVKLWYLSTFFRSEAPQRGRYRQFWQVGAEAIGSDAPETDAELIVLLADLLDSLGAREIRCRLASLGTPETRAEYREQLKAYLRANEDRLSAEVRERIDLNPMRAFDASDPRDARGDERRTEADGPARTRGCRALLARARAARPRRAHVRPRHHARARARLLHAHAVRVHQRRARRTVGRWGRRALRPPDRAARRAADPGLRVGRRRRADAAGQPRAAGAAGARRPVRRPGRSLARGAPRSCSARMRAVPDSRHSSSSRAAR